ncbi:hypothetical protein DV735_g186, partial [Chaetothyriales sp. CBS 134920]
MSAEIVDFTGTDDHNDAAATDAKRPSEEARTFQNAVAGYVLLEYPTQVEAQAAIEALDGTKLLDQTIRVDYAFVRPPPKDKARRDRARDRDEPRDEDVKME